MEKLNSVITTQSIFDDLVSKCPERGLVSVEQIEPSDKTCADCGSVAHFKIVDDNGSHVWYYCGVCDIGG